MDNQDVSVLAITLMISCSGIVINFIKKGESKFAKEDTSLLWFRILIPLGLVTSLLSYFLKIGNLSLSTSSSWLGYFMVAFGLVFRWIAIIALGKAFTVKVSILEDHILKTDGIYKHIRHPSYTGLLIYYIGLGLVMQNWISALVLIVFPAFAVINRIRIEEKVLMEHFSSDYKNYQKRSWRLFPFLF